MMIIENKFEIGDTVYLVTDREQVTRMVIGFCIRPKNNILYDLTSGNLVSSHYEFEISREENTAMKVIN